jgi:hypothetical protein
MRAKQAAGTFPHVKRRPYANARSRGEEGHRWHHRGGRNKEIDAIPGGRLGYAPSF